MKTKIIQFKEVDDQHARMIVRLRYDRLTQGNFFRGVVKLYVDNDLEMAKIVERIKIEKSSMGKRKRKASVKEIEQGEEILHDLGLTENEKNFIFDLLEEDFEEE